MRKKNRVKQTQKSVLIPEVLHAQLKHLADSRGMKLGAMVEFKLRELIQPEQLQLAAN